MADVGVKLKLRGINALMTSQPVVSLVAERAARIARAAGPNFERAMRPHKYTARAYVQNANREGAEEEARDKRLTRALDAGR